MCIRNDIKALKDIGIIVRTTSTENQIQYKLRHSLKHKTWPSGLCMHLVAYVVYNTN